VVSPSDRTRLGIERLDGLGARAALGKLARQIQLVPLVATSLPVEPNPKTAEYARRHGVVLLRAADIDRILDWVNTKRTYATLLSYLEQLKEE